MAQLLTSLEDAYERCREQNLRLSRQRCFILELLWQCDEHLSAREIYDRLNQSGKSIGHTSVYQNLDALASHEVIECLERAEGRRYGRATHPHSHVNCLDSNRIIDIEVELPAELVAAVETQTQTRIQSYRIEFYGQDQSHLSSTPESA